MKILSKNPGKLPDNPPAIPEQNQQHLANTRLTTTTSKIPAQFVLKRGHYRTKYLQELPDNLIPVFSKGYDSGAGLLQKVMDLILSRSLRNAVRQARRLGHLKPRELTLTGLVFSKGYVKHPP